LNAVQDVIYNMSGIQFTRGAPGIQGVSQGEMR